ncbi:trypsin-like serine protease [Pedobacter sp. MC2016-05]|uniref:trypsin-like serine protease n=1 Tax=Pedobacter sp. MC2016-05 TaxID=2994474 RepID=UPI0022485B79|nr:trypsin-like serine protease [Pedobacter sp. MC2016-05]MCX2472906.1 trypsin-like serine protease [Pedobacter sp. MC2016-05]
MKSIILTVAIFIIVSSCYGQEATSSKKFEDIALVNKIDFFDSKFNQTKFGCGFLLKFNQDTFAVTAKHLIKFIKSDEMKGISFDNGIKNWMLFNLNKPSANVVVDKLLNENKNESIAEKASYEDDWLVFSIKQNQTRVKVLEIRDTPLNEGEKLYVVGWTRKMESGLQRVYEFEYFKTVGKRILLKDVIVPELFGGLSGAPVIDENAKVVGIVSGRTADPDSKKTYFSPSSVNGLKSFLDKLEINK